jgi:hypothetical protein
MREAEELRAVLTSSKPAGQQNFSPAFNVYI